MFLIRSYFFSILRTKWHFAVHRSKTHSKLNVNFLAGHCQMFLDWNKDRRTIRVFVGICQSRNKWKKNKAIFPKFQFWVYS